MSNKELTIRQIGEFCTNTLCKKCPIKKWNEESGLKPCPFCGGEAKAYCNYGGFWGVDCESDECITHTMVVDYNKEEDAIEAWNRRAE